MIHTIRGVQCRISDPIRKSGYPKISDRGNCDPNPIRNFRISELFGSDHRVFGSDTGFSDRVRWIFWKIPIRKPEFFPDTRSEISEILKSDRISEISDRIGGFSDRIFLHTPTYNKVIWRLVQETDLGGLCFRRGLGWGVICVGQRLGWSEEMFELLGRQGWGSIVFAGVKFQKGLVSLLTRFIIYTSSVFY